MMLQTVGGSRLVRLMRVDQPRTRERAWLEGAPDPAEPPRLTPPSAPVGSVPNTGRQ
jgi:hypothetical protein